MTLSYPLLHILIYLGVLLAPPDTDRITITGPGQNVEIVRTGLGWVAYPQDGHSALVTVYRHDLTL